MGGMLPHELTEKKIHKLVERCKSNATKYGSYTTTKEDYSMIPSESINRVIALIEEDNKHICIIKQTSTLFETKKNPNYETTESVKSTNNVQKIALIFTTILVFIGTSIQYFSWKVSKDNLRLLESQLYQDSIQKAHKIKSINELDKKLISIQKEVDSIRFDKKK
jgi:hypothetical protein